MSVSNFQELTVWQKSIDLVIEIYRITKLLPKEEIYALSNQMRRAAVSIPSNIAEGQQRQSTKEFVNFLSISRGSNAEIETQLIICEKLNYLTAEQIKYAMSLCGEIGKMLNAMIVKLS
jgi:four helix bundle protein